MTYTAIDGDVSDFLDSMIEISGEFRTDELRAYLVNEGHAAAEADDVIQRWQEERFQRSDPSWETLTLTQAGVAAVEELRERLD